MILPNADKAFIDIRKLRDYSLSFESPKGRHKARIFASKLGITSEDNEAKTGEIDLFGQRYTVDFHLKTEIGEADVRSG